VGGGGSNTATQLTTIPDLGSVVSVAAGAGHALALGADGSVFGWGQNSDGQLGDQTNINRSSPTPVQGLPPARLISTGAFHSCAVTENEGVYCWGRGVGGELGTGVRVNSASPVRVALP
jgi:alpha-tubulin suppressor-like RCC1 family protein